MARAAFYLETLPKFYREMKFLSYHVTEHRNVFYDPYKYITVVGFHPDCHLVTIVQGDSSAYIISEQELSPQYDANDEDRPRVRKTDAEMEAEGKFAFDVALAEAREASVIGPTVKSFIVDKAPRLLTPFEHDLVSEHGWDAYEAYRASLPDPN